MASRLYVLLVIVLFALPAAQYALGQTMLPAPAPYPPERKDQNEPLPGLPRPPDVPHSLLEPAPPAPSFSCADLPGPYFELDPRLDPPCFPQPGWFTEVELGIVGAHVKNRLTDRVQVDGRPPDMVHLPGAPLDWTVAPGVAIGYRLPSGFGDFLLHYHFLNTDGTGSVAGPDAVAALKSRLAINVADLDYASREFYTLQWPYVEMKWWFGLRFADAFFDSRAEEPLAAAALGSGILETRVSNNFWGIGPHVGAELSRRFNESGLMLVSSVDGATLLGRIRQNFSEESTASLIGSTRASNPQDVPIVKFFFGVAWQPTSSGHIRMDAGYEYEYWWNVGRITRNGSRGELSNQGVLLRAAYNW
jgi:hypothetical protein